MKSFQISIIIRNAVLLFILIALLFACNRGVFHSSENISKFQKRDSIVASGSIQTYLANDSLYLEAKSSFISKDSMIFEGMLTRNKSSKNIYFTLVVNLKSISTKIIRRGNRYLIDFRAFEPELSRYEFELTKTKNFVLEKGVLNLYSGIVSDSLGNTFKYIVMDDPNGIEKSIGSVGFLTIVAGKIKYSFLEKCRLNFGNQCTEYKLYAKVGFFDTEIYCRCKD